MLILGVTFFIWGIYLTFTGMENRKNLNHIYDAWADTMDLKENAYIEASKIRLLTVPNLGLYVPIVRAWVGLTYEDDYYIANLDMVSDNYYVIKVSKEFNDFLEYIDYEEGICDFENPVKDIPAHAANFKFAAKIVKIDSEGRDIIDSAKEEDRVLETWTANERIMLEVVDLEQERRVLTAGIVILLTGLSLFIASKPWKIVTIREAALDKEFNLIYSDKEKADEQDIRFIEDVARELRIDIAYYGKRYNLIKKKVIRNALAFIISLVIFLKIRILFILLIITVLLFIKFLFSIATLILNQDTSFSKAALSVFNRNPVLSTLHDREEKLAKCDRIISKTIFGQKESAESEG